MLKRALDPRAKLLRIGVAVVKSRDVVYGVVV
jgi:hypothetical protein